MIRHTLIYMVAYALPGLLGFFSFGIYTRVLSPSEYAVYSVGASVSFLIGNVCFGWIRFSVGRFQAELPEFNFLPFALACLLGTTVIVGPLLAFGAVAAEMAPAIVVFGALSMTFGQALFDTTQEMRRARHQSVAFSKASVLRSALSIGLSASAASYFHRGVAVLFGAAAGFFALGVAYVVRNRRSLSGRDIGLGPTRRFLAYGMPLAMSGLVISGNSTLARVMVTSELGTAAAGQYGAALDITGQLMTVIAGSVCSIMGPAAIRAYGLHGKAAAQKELETGLELYLGILMPVVVGLACVAGPFAAVVSGRDFEGLVGRLIPFLAVSRGLNVFAQFYLHLGFQIVEKPMRQVICGGVTLAVNLVMNFVLTKWFGLSGAAVALIIADLCGVLVSFLLLRPVFPMPFPLAKVAPIAAATAAMAIVCRLTMSAFSTSAPPASGLIELLTTVAAGVVVYAAMVVALDIAQVRTMLASRGYRFVLKQQPRV